MVFGSDGDVTLRNPNLADFYLIKTKISATQLYCSNFQGTKILTSRDHVKYEQFKD